MFKTITQTSLAALLALSLPLSGPLSAQEDDTAEEAPTEDTAPDEAEQTPESSGGIDDLSMGVPAGDWNRALGAGKVAVPLLAAHALVLALGEAAAPLAGADQAQKNGIHPHVRRQFDAERAQQVLHPGAGRGGTDHVRLGLAGQQAAQQAM